MLRRIGTGLLLLLLVQCSYAIFELVGHSIDNTVHCIFAPVQSQKMPISIAFMLIPQFVRAFGELLLFLTSLEFVVAQSPTHMRAMMIRLWFAVFGLVRLLNCNMHHLFFPHCFLDIKHSSCWFHLLYIRSIHTHCMIPKYLTRITILHNQTPSETSPSWYFIVARLLHRRIFNLAETVENQLSR